MIEKRTLYDACIATYRHVASESNVSVFELDKSRKRFVQDLRGNVYINILTELFDSSHDIVVGTLLCVAKHLNPNPEDLH